MSAGPSPHAVETRRLTREYRLPRREQAAGGVVRALSAVDLRIARGELYGLLGPNGAGKTTLLKILTTLLYPTSGEAWVAGHEVVREAQAVRERIGLVSGGEYAGYGVLTVEETLHMFGLFYGATHREARRRAGELMETLDLAELARRRVSRLSAGQRQRLQFARGFMGDPEIVFLDEPTLGLDVAGAREVRSFVRRWLTERPARTVLLTTHYLAEADELCGRISIIDHGRILATDTPSGLRGRVPADRRVELEVGPADGLAESIAGVRGVRELRRIDAPESETTRFQFRLADDRGLAEVLELLSVRRVVVHTLRTHEPSLEDVFVAIVGRGIEEGDDGA
jgi:ABC-2 type transport system ATP-binding protein